MSITVIDDGIKEVVFLLFDHYELSYRQISKYLYRHYKVNVSHMTVFRLLNS